MPRIRSRLWWRIAAICILVSALPLVGARFAAVYMVEDTVRADATRRLHAAGREARALVRGYLRNAEGKLTALARQFARPEADTPDDARAEAVDRLTELVAPSDTFLELAYFEPGADDVELIGVSQPGAVYRGNAATHDSAALKAAANERAERTRTGAIVRNPMAKGKRYVGAWLEHIGEFSGVPIAVPVVSGDRVLGVIVGTVDFAPAQDLLASITAGGYHVRLITGRGAVLAEAGAANDDSLLAVTPVGHGSWQIEVREPTEAALASIAVFVRHTWLWLLIGVTLAALVGVALSRRLILPLRQLTETANRMKSGDLAARADIARGDEIGQLGSAFDQMATELERLDGARSEFVANVSHELRTPLTSMQLSIRNLVDGVVGPVTDEQRATLDRIAVDAVRLIDLVQALLELAKIEAGALAPTLEKIDLAELARDAVAEIEPIATRKQISLELTGAGSADADPVMLRRVIANLLDNAVKFTPSEGEVRVSVGDRSIRVADTGPGVQIDDAFEKFSQGEQRGAKPRGAGLGLAIARKLVEINSGTIEYEAGPGATFVVRL